MLNQVFLLTLLSFFLLLNQAFFPICDGGHFYVVVFSLSKSIGMTILDNIDSGESYDKKYKGACDVLVSLS